MEEVIRRFNNNGVKYLLIGGQAVRFEGMPRYSVNWDFFIPPRDKVNMEKINRLLRFELADPLVPLGRGNKNFIQTYQTRWGLIQFHLKVDGMPDFETSLKGAVIRRTDTALSVQCASGHHVLESKLKANRNEDQLDIEFLTVKKRLGFLR